VFLVSEAQGGKVRNPKKLQSIKQMLNVYMQDEDIVANGDDTDDTHRIETTVFELAGVDRVGILADVMQLLAHNGCDVRSAAVWTYRGRVAFVFSVTEKGKPVADELKLQRLRQMVEEIMHSIGGSFTVRTLKVKGEVHHDRRLHQLMLQEERLEWERANARSGIWKSSNGGSGITKSLSFSKNTMNSSPADSVMSVLDPPEETHSGGGNGNGHSNGHTLGGGGRNSSNGDLATSADSPYRSPKFESKPTIDIGHCHRPDYWTVNIKCRDRTKLLFDTVCTLADMDFDIYHATIDSDSEGWAHQEFFLCPRSGDGDFTPQAAALLQAMLVSSIQRRFPKGIKVHVRSMDRFGCLASLARQLQISGLSITRAKARTFATSNSSGHTLYVMDAQGAPPDRQRVQGALMQCGGKMIDSTDSGENINGHRHHSGSNSTVGVPNAGFSFTFYDRNGSGGNGLATNGNGILHTASFGGGSPDSYFGSM
jgi:glycine cleavage system regulatory protein